MIIPHLISGALYGWAAYRTGSLWMSLGLHLSNNYSTLVLVGAKGDALTTFAPFLVEASDVPMVSFLTAVHAVAIVAMLRLVSLYRLVQKP